MVACVFASSVAAAAAVAVAAAEEGQWAVGQGARRHEPTTYRSSMAWWSMAEEGWGPRGGLQAPGGALWPCCAFSP